MLRIHECTIEERSYIPVFPHISGNGTYNITFILDHYRPEVVSMVRNYENNIHFDVISNDRIRFYNITLNEGVDIVEWLRATHQNYLTQRREEFLDISNSN